MDDRLKSGVVSSPHSTYCPTNTRMTVSSRTTAIAVLPSSGIPGVIFVVAVRRAAAMVTRRTAMTVRATATAVRRRTGVATRRRAGVATRRRTGVATRRRAGVATRRTPMTMRRRTGAATRATRTATTMRVRAIFVSVLVGAVVVAAASVVVGALLRLDELLHLLHHLGVVDQIHVLRLQVHGQRVAAERGRGRASSDVTRVAGAGGVGHLGEQTRTTGT